MLRSFRAVLRSFRAVLRSFRAARCKISVALRRHPERPRGRIPMEIYQNTYQIQSLYGGRNLFQYLFVGEQQVLIDSGIAKTPENVIFPFMDQLKLNPQQLRLVVTTHPDLDHQGGNDAIKQAAPNAWLACGTADRELIEHPRTLFEKTNNFLR